MNNSQFCARCGLPLEDVKRLLGADGELKKLDEEKAVPALSARQRGIRQGAKLVLLCLVLLPLHLLAEGLLPSVENTNLDELPQLVLDALLWVILLSGFARILYAMVFESVAVNELEEAEPGRLSGARERAALPPSQGVPVTDFGFRRVNTAEMVETPSVTERTTSLLNER
ncbi:MAG TPA: hypothetical protein VGV59_18190 [Pyrinomonadaceae bacterium]|nr:hypothetical protein [Pyrinomonadaceae bacterium]